MQERFSNRQSLMDAATVLAARRAIDRELAHLIADPFDRDAAKRLHDAVGANADRAQEALERLVHVTKLREPWAFEALGTGPGAGSDDEVAPPIPSPHRNSAGVAARREEPNGAGVAARREEPNSAGVAARREEPNSAGVAARREETDASHEEPAS